MKKYQKIWYFEVFQIRQCLIIDLVLYVKPSTTVPIVNCYENKKQLHVYVCS